MYFRALQWILKWNQNEENSKYRICNNTFISSPDGFEKKILLYVPQWPKYIYCSTLEGGTEQREWSALRVRNTLVVNYLHPKLSLHLWIGNEIDLRMWFQYSQVFFWKDFPQCYWELSKRRGTKVLKSRAR